MAVGTKTLHGLFGHGFDKLVYALLGRGEPAIDSVERLLRSGSLQEVSRPKLRCRCVRGQEVSSLAPGHQPFLRGDRLPPVRLGRRCA